MTIAILLLITYTLLDTIEDWGYIKGKSSVWHFADACTRTIIFGYIAYKEFGLSENTAYFILLALSCYWLIFDLAINYSRHLPLLYVGSGSIDKTFKSIFGFTAGLIMMVAKLVCITCSLILLW
jgi:hypothetical protein